MPIHKNDPFGPVGIRPPDGYIPFVPSNTLHHTGSHPLVGDVVYRNAGDQILAGSGTFMADIDGSNTREISFEYQWQQDGGGASFALVTFPQGGSRLLRGDDGSPRRVAAGEAIGPTPSQGSWATGGMVLARRATVGGNPGPWTGPWVGVSRGYLGLEMATADGPRYTWIRVSVAPDTGTLTVHGYAFRYTPEAPISAGDEGGA